MKINIFRLLLLLLPTLLFSQNSNDKTVYLDSTCQVTTEGNHKFYRIIKDYYIEKDSYKIYDYYKSGVLEMEGVSSSKDELTKEGEFVFYFENGNKKNITNYIKSRPNGKGFEWYENGNKKLEGEYFESNKTFNSDFKIDQFWNKEGEQKVINGNGYFEEVTKNSSESGKINNGLKEGDWKGEVKGLYSYVENYKKGKLTSGLSIDKENNQQEYKVLDSRPLPKKGMAHFYKYIGKEVKLTKVTEVLNGKVIIQFIVDKEGKLVEPKVIKSLEDSLDQEVIRVLTSYESWIPGKQRGRNVRVIYTIPVMLSGGR